MHSTGLAQGRRGWGDAEGDRVKAEGEQQDSRGGEGVVIAVSLLEAARHLPEGECVAEFAFMHSHPHSHPHSHVKKTLFSECECVSE